jgi:8-oxo-dGTP diphosphatase
MPSLPTKQVVAAIAIMERNGRFLVLRRIDPEPQLHHKWEFPGGGIEWGETPLETLKREMKEETGLIVQDATLLGIHTHVWDLPTERVQVFLIVYCAQADSEEVVLSPEENDAYKWVTADEFLVLPDLLGGGQKIIEELYLPFIASRHKS